MPKELRREKYSRFYSLFSFLIVAFTVIAGGVLAWGVSRTVHGASESPLGDLLPSFGPAALFASGRGMVLPLNGVPPELDAFLNGRAAQFDPASLPENFSGPHIFGSYTDTFPLTHWLLFYSVGWAWRLFGIHYGALHLLAGVLGAFAAAALYTLFRLGMNRLFACAGTLLTLLLPPFLLLMPSLRDFSKAPFILLFMAVSGLCLIRRRPPRFLFLASPALALVPGIGYGFRQDILICLPVACLVLAALPLKSGYHPFLRAAAAALFLALFALVAAPVLRGMRHESGSVTTHTLFQGLSREAEQTMYFGDASYDLLLTPSDPETHAVVNAHARMHGMTEPMSLYLSPAYARAGRALFREWALTFPADLFARGLASIESVQRLAALTLDSPQYAKMEATVGAWPLFRWHHGYTAWVEPAGPFLVAAALFLIGLRSRKAMLAVLLVLGYFMAYPSLLFQVRHAFHLTFVMPWAGLYVLQRLVLGPILLFNRPLREALLLKRGEGAYTGRALAGTLGIIVVLVAGCFLVLCLLRVAQTVTLRRIAGAYRNAAMVPISTTSEDLDDYRVFRPERLLPGLEESWNLPLGDTATSYIAVSFEPAAYAFPLQVRYQPRRGAYMTRHFIVPATPQGTGETLYFIPIYELADYNPTEFLLAKHRFNNSPLANLLVHPLGTNKFEGIGLRPDAAPLFKKMYYVENHARLPWLLYLRLPEDRNHFEPYKRFGWEKAVRMLPVEFRYRATKDAEQAITDYFELLARFPGYRPYAERIRGLIPHLPTPAGRADALFRLSGYELYTGGGYAMELSEIAGNLAAEGDFEQAERIYRRAAALAPEDLWHQTHLADTLLARGNAVEAVPLYAAVLKKAPESPYSAVQFDRACRQTEQADYRLAFWESLHDQAPQAMVPGMHLARALEDHNRWEEAASLYERLLETHKGNAEIEMRYGVLVAVTTEFARGRALMDQALEKAPELKSLYINELTRLAGLYTEAGNHAFAEAIYWEVASLSPEDPEHIIHLADMLAARGETEKALEQYSLVLKRKPESPYSADRIDALLKKNKTTEEQLHYWEEARNLHPMAVVPALFLARAYEGAGRWVEALTMYHCILDNHPEHPETLMRYGTLTAMNVDFDQGYSMMDQALAAEPELKSLYEAGLARIADARAESGDHAAAVTASEKLSAMALEDLGRLVTLADALMAAGRKEEAADRYKEVLRKAPDSSYSANRLDGLLKASGPDARIVFWEEVSKQHPDAYLPSFYLGMAHEETGNYDMARLAYLRAQEVDPSNTAAKIRLAAVSLRLELPESGIALMRNATADAPECRNEGARALASAAAEREQKEHYADAEALYKEAMLLAPEDSGNSYTLGTFYLNQDRVDEAFPLLKAVLTKNPDAPLTADSMDHIFVLRNDTEGRLAFWRDLVEKHPKAVIPLYHLALALEANDRKDEAAAIYQQVLVLQPEMQDAAERLQDLLNTAGPEGKGSR